jgi:hypothetical protein
MNIYKYMPSGNVDWQAHGIRTDMQLLSKWHFYHKVDGVYDTKPGINLDLLASRLRQQFPDGPGHRMWSLDVEWFHRDADPTKYTWAFYDHTPAEIDRHTKMLIDATNVVKDFAPNALVGVYAHYPYAGAALWYGRASLENRPELRESRHAWERYHQRLRHGRDADGKVTSRGLADVVGVTMPTLYPVWYEKYNWTFEYYKSLRDIQREIVLDAAAAAGKDCVAWLSTRSWGEGSRLAGASELVDEIEAWNNSQWCAGVVIYDAFVPRETDPWLAELRNRMGVLDSSVGEFPQLGFGE